MLQEEVQALIAHATSPLPKKIASTLQCVMHVPGVHRFCFATSRISEPGRFCLCICLIANIAPLARVLSSLSQGMFRLRCATPQHACCLCSCCAFRGLSGVKRCALAGASGRRCAPTPV